MKRSVPVTFYVVTCLAILLGCLGGRHEDRLINDIFNNRNYNKYGRPVENESQSLEVIFHLSLQQILRLDQKSEVLHTNMWLNYEWKDYNLHWIEEEYGHIESIVLPSNMIWTPKILMYNSADEAIDNTFAADVVITSDGTCSWVPLGLLKSSCPIDIQWFPFDEQRCHMKFGSWTYDGGKINLTSTKNKIELSTYKKNGEWDLVDAIAKRHELYYDCCRDPYVDITSTILIRRRTLYYGINLIIPCVLISFLTLLIFLLPPDAGEKIGLGITILLSLSVFQLIVAETVPTTSLTIPLLGMYFAVVMVMTAISVVMTVVVLNFHHRNPDNMGEIPAIIKLVVCDWMAWILRMSRPGNEIKCHISLMRHNTNLDQEEKFPDLPTHFDNVHVVGNVIQASAGVQLANVSNDKASVSGSCRDIDIAINSEVEMSLKAEIRAIQNELKYITTKMKNNERYLKLTNDWKWAAMVIDRLCFWIFTLYFSISTLVIFLSAPNISA